jgi:hypothetical protein
LKKTIVTRAPFLQTFSNQELNNKLGNYADIIQSLQDKIDTIDRRGFREYIYALEAHGRLKEAMEAIETSTRFQNDTDFMGILGGRYKRKYLISGFENDKIKSIELYRLGFDQSKVKGDHAQIYYHAINLAFLYVYGDNNREEMKKYADEALGGATASNQTDRWELATKAEASLYLNNFDDAKKYYASAIQKAGNDERAISSMYVNTYGLYCQ